ncbi:MAG: type 1 glutamine amidotransferase [Deltaproteobacteria bacterium]|nr:type 1 glutamine amidotransferase [Deltaproteobacteria bacterium]
MRNVLVSLRDSGDPMSRQELRCFAESTGLPGLEIAYASAGGLDERLLDEAGMLFFGGSGAYSVLDTHDWVKRMLDALVATVDRKIPAWASCFGFQGLALALGGEVNHDDARRELGAFPIHLTADGRADPLMGHLSSPFFAQLGHHDHVDRLPSGVTLLATGEKIHNQAFKVDGAPFWATQFHPELRKATTIERWNFYRAHYADDAGARAIDRAMEATPDTPEAQTILTRFVQWARANPRR